MLSSTASTSPPDPSSPPFPSPPFRPEPLPPKWDAWWMPWIPLSMCTNTNKLRLSVVEGAAVAAAAAGAVFLALWAESSAEAATVCTGWVVTCATAGRASISRFKNVPTHVQQLARISTQYPALRGPCMLAPDAMHVHFLHATHTVHLRFLHAPDMIHLYAIRGGQLPYVAEYALSCCFPLKSKHAHRAFNRGPSMGTG
eukprot:1158960-Pelagomonas_calceolata.AAC.4